MSKSVVRVLTCVAAALLAAAAAPTFAATQRTFVASYGVDTNPCSRTQPCRGFAAALLQTNAGGEIIVLDSAGYGPVTIDKALSIIAPPGVYAGVTNGSGDGIVVNAPDSAVVLRGLDVNGLGTSGGSGILHQAAASLVVDRCTVTGFGSPAISINAGPVTVSDTVVKDSLGGIVVHGTDAANFVRVTIVRSRIERNGGTVGFPSDAGVAAVGGAFVTVEDSVAVGNFRGFSACNVGGSEPLGAVLSINRSVSARNAVGMFLGPNGAPCEIRVSNSTITDNTVLGIESQGGGPVSSLGNNFVFNNAGGETFGATVSPK